MSFIDHYISKLSDIQRQEIETHIKSSVRKGDIRGQRDFSRELAEALKKVTSDNLPISTAHPVAPLSRTDADHYNEFMSNFKIDIRALFRECNRSDYLIGLEEAENKDFQDTITSLIKSINGELAARKAQLAATQGYTSVFYEPFNDPAQRELNNVKFDNDGMRIMPRNSETYSFDIERVEILRYPRTGVTYVTDPEFDPVLNPLIFAPGAAKGYWAEMALAAEIPTVEFRNDSEIPLDRKFDGILAVCRITFSTPISFNALGIDPYCEFSLTIPWLRYRSSIAGEWQYLTQDGLRIATSGSGHINIGNIDRALVKVLEIPLYQPSASLINTAVSPNDETHLDFFKNLIDGDIAELQQEIDTFLSEKSSNTTYKKALTRLISTEDVEAATKSMFDILGLSPRQVKITNRGVISSQETCPLWNMSTIGGPLNNAFLYGFYNLRPSSISYNKAGIYKSPIFNNLRKQIVSAGIEADYDTPAISSVGFFLELESGSRFTILPRGSTRIREHIPVVPDKHGFPKGYYTNEPGPDEFVTGSVSGEYRALNRVFPSFYIDTDKEIKFYRNGVQIPSADMEIDETFRMFNIVASGDQAGHAPFGANDVLVVEYDIDPDYGPPGQKLEEAPALTMSGDYVMQLDFDVNTTKPRSLYITTPTSQWVLVDESDYILSSNTIIISGDYLTDYFQDTSGLSMLYQYYSFDEDFNGPKGRRDFSGSPDRIDIIEGSSRIIGKSAPAFSVVAKKYSGKFKLSNGMIKLPHSPVIDFNLYNYDGTWKMDPEYPDHTYVPIDVKVGSIPQDAKAIDITQYKTEEIPHLVPFDEIGFYQFYLRDDTIFFNIDETDVDITISYEYIASSARIAIELYTNQPGVSDYTPVVRDFTLRLGMI